MDFKYIVEKIFQMEQDMDLFNKQIDGVFFWELIRFNVVSQIAQKIGVYGQAHTKLDFDSEYVINYIFNSIKNIFHKNPFFGSKTDLLFLGHQRRKMMDDGLWWDVYCDLLIDNVDMRRTCLLLESPYLNKHLVPAKTSNIRYLDVVRFAGSLLRRTKLMRVTLTDADKDLIRSIERRIWGNFEVSIDFLFLVSRTLLSRKCMLPVYICLLKKIQPKVVFIVVSYGHEVLVQACKNLGVPSVEIQHGVIGRYKVAYSFPGKMITKRTFPDYFFSFGDYWKHLVDFPIPEDRVVSVGYPFFETQVAKFRHEPKLDQIIFVSQGTIGQGMSKFAVELKTRSDFKLDIVYKLHPGEYSRWKNVYPWLKDTGIKVVDDESIPLYKLLAQSKALVGVYSTVVYEGLGLGLPTYLVDLPGIEYMDELIASGAATKVTTVDELIAALDNPQSKPVPAERFFKPNALENISNALEEILSGGRGA